MKTNNAHFFTRQRYLFLFSVLGFFLIQVNVFCGDTLRSDTKESKYPFFYKGNYTIDARLSDWPSKMFYDNIEAMLVYAVANDSSRLYFCIQVLDKLEQMNILHEGLTVNIEDNGKKKESGAVSFPYGPVKPYEGPPSAGAGERQSQIVAEKASPPPGDHQIQGQPQPKGQPPAQGQSVNQGPPVLKQKARRFSAGLKLSGFREGIDGIYPPDSAVRGVETALAYDSTGALVIEAAIPLSYFKEDLRTSKYVMLSFVVSSGSGGEGGGHQGGSGGLQGMSMNGGGMSGGGGGMHGGGMHGGGQRGMGNNSSGGPPRDSSTPSQAKSYKTGHKFCIATAP